MSGLAKSFRFLKRTPGLIHEQLKSNLYPYKPTQMLGHSAIQRPLEQIKPGTEKN